MNSKHLFYKQLLLEYLSPGAKRVGFSEVNLLPEIENAIPLESAPVMSLDGFYSFEKVKIPDARRIGQMMETLRPGGVGLFRISGMTLRRLRRIIQAGGYRLLFAVPSLGLRLDALLYNRFKPWFGLGLIVIVEKPITPIRVQQKEISIVVTSLNASDAISQWTEAWLSFLNERNLQNQSELVLALDYDLPHDHVLRLLEKRGMINLVTHFKKTGEDRLIESACFQASGKFVFFDQSGGNFVCEQMLPLLSVSVAQASLAFQVPINRTDRLSNRPSKFAISRFKTQNNQRKLFAQSVCFMVPRQHVNTNLELFSGIGWKFGFLKQNIPIRGVFLAKHI